MTTRITPEMQGNLLLNNINNYLAALDRSQNELSTGVKISQPSDNPYGTALSMQLNTQISTMQSFGQHLRRHRLGEHRQHGAAEHPADDPISAHARRRGGQRHAELDRPPSRLAAAQRSRR